jgi:hypothetical protein
MRPVATALRLVLAAVLVSGCQFLAPNNGVVWTDRVPTPAPEAVAAQTVIARTATSRTILPISPTGAEVGVGYAYDMPHCGLGSPIDIDGTFWDAADALPDPVSFDGLSGTFRLTTSTTATFTSVAGAVLHLVRHVGAKEFHHCM